jgi:type IV pilus assembly protein PilM
VAVRRQQVEDLDLLCKVAGLNLIAVEIEPLAIHRVLGPIIEQENEAFLNVGASRSWFAIFRQGIMVYYRSLALGFSPIYNVQNENPLMLSQVQDTLGQQTGRYEDFVRDMLAEMARFIEYYDIQNRGNEVPNIYLMGGGSRLAGMATALKEGLGRDVLIADSLAHVRIPFKTSEEDYDMLKHDFTVAIGLAARNLV